VDWDAIPVKKPVLGQQFRPFQLENTRELCQSLLRELSQSLLDVSCIKGFHRFLNSSGDSNHTVCSLFHHLGLFSSLTALMIQFIILIYCTGSVCPRIHVVDQQYCFLPTFYSPGEHGNENDFITTVPDHSDSAECYNEKIQI
jgi:hypothetical protein